ncbi:AAA family ATPase [Halovulum dunhuangense]|uniref:AAA family ATPase n=1 Tax=Halovulum dunhuangense TaxID=1505036 RepID=A0A849L2A5_9RHOB|nr:AAA family ATPase [Halovulum dunhuangense]NNU80362.1 AAA family ATPase [Halovulum dunhuangense]
MRVIAVSGVPGSGKTTLARALAQGLGARLVEYDRHEAMTRRPPAEIEDWLGRGAPYAEIPVPGLRAAVQEAAALGPVVFDTPLGRALPETADLIDLSVWLDCPRDLALARKIAQLSHGVKPGSGDQFARWLCGYLGAYESVIGPACRLQECRVRPLADLRVPEAQTPDAAISLVMRAVGANT